MLTSSGTSFVRILCPWLGQRSSRQNTAPRWNVRVTFILAPHSGHFKRRPSVDGIREAEQRQLQRKRERREREYAAKQKRDSSEPDPERYRLDPEYRRHVQNTQSWKTRRTSSATAKTPRELSSRSATGDGDTGEAAPDPLR